MPTPEIDIRSKYIVVSSAKMTFKPPSVPVWFQPKEKDEPREKDATCDFVLDTQVNP